MARVRAARGVVRPGSAAAALEGCAVDPHSLALAYALSTIAGLRASLTVLAVSVAVHLHVLATPASMPWLASDATVVIAAIFAIVDSVADKLPVVDHGLHIVHLVLAPIGGAIAAAGVDPSGSTSLAVVALLGGANAFGVNGLRGATRASSSAFSLGLFNPVLSIVEDVAAIAGVVLAFIAPFAVAGAALVLCVLFVILLRSAFRRRAAVATPR